jgi:hypothetical protein
VAGNGVQAHAKVEAQQQVCQGLEGAAAKVAQRDVVHRDDQPGHQVNQLCRQTDRQQGPRHDSV